ncbi:hypothetical protein GR925_29375 [Streptomyces sp. HUCO-GS316]|uniref:hypothetical protein n=1 Tax=Streptomyces sp. HUCO-GS316 TaxID=2692198 RepID=UPI001371A150|nr:hypothetical protein [Streptomyces sp. HUCO-GS316]MXM67432.1 hypothetical protein [Streptomyces sp. HUCO-GS316]
MTAERLDYPHTGVTGASRRRRPALVLALAGLTAFASLTVFGSPDERVRPDLRDGSVWLPSTGPGLLTQMNGVALSPQFQLPMPALRGQERVTVAGSLVVTGSPGHTGDESSYSLVDPVGLRVDGPFTGSGTCAYTVVGTRVYCVDSAHGDLVDVRPGTEPAWEQRVRLGGRLGQLARDRHGTLWVGLPSSGAVAALRGGSGKGRVRRTTVGAPGDQVWLATVGKDVFAVDTDGAFFVALTGDGPHAKVPLPDSVSPRDPVVGVGAPSSSARHLVLLLRSGTLVSVDPRTGAEVATVRTGLPADRTAGGDFVEAGDLVHLPQENKGRVLVVDMRTGHVHAPVRVTSAAASLQLVEDAGAVWIHNPRGPEGVMVRAGRARAFRKYDTDKPPTGRHGGADAEPSPSTSPTTASDRPPTSTPTPAASATYPGASPSARPSPRPGVSGRPPGNDPGTGAGDPAPGPGDGTRPTPTDGPGSRPTPTGGPTGPSGEPSDSPGIGGRPERLATLPATGSAGFRPDGAVLALSDELWDVSDPARVRRIGALPYNHLQAALYLTSPVFTPDGTTVFARGRYETYAYDVQDPTAPRHLAGWGSAHPSSGLALSVDGRKLAYGTSDLLGRSGSYELMDVSDPGSPRVITGGGIQVESPVWHTSISADGTLVAASLNHDVAVLDVSHPEPGDEENPPGPSTQLSLTPDLGEATFAPRGRLLVAQDEGGGWVILSLTDPTNPRTVARETGLEGVREFHFSRDGKRLTLLGGTGTPGTATAQIWDVSRPERPRLLHQMPAPDGASLALDPTGTLLAVSGGTGTELWRIP